MLACARLGAVHSVVFGGFAPREPALRIDDARPKVVVSVFCGIEGSRVIPYKPLLDKALHLATHPPGTSVILQRPEAHAELSERDVDWDEAMASAAPADCVPLAATDPALRPVHLGHHGPHQGRGARQRRPRGRAGDAWWAASDAGRVVGHSYIVYAPLLTGATSVLYEGKPVGSGWHARTARLYREGSATWRPLSIFSPV